MGDDLDEIIQMTVAICRSSEPTTIDHLELINKRNQMVRELRKKLNPKAVNWMEKLGFELRIYKDYWIVVDDCGNEREATLNERVLWDALMTAREA